MNRKDAERKRERAIRQLRASGMRDAEIEAELGRPLNHVASERGSGRDDEESAEIIDAEIVENLPAVINESYGSAGPVEEKPHPSRPGRDETNRSTVKENVAEYDASLEKNAERRCTARNSKGEQCRKYAIFGGRVCKTHGGSAPHVIEKARIKLAMAAVPLVGKLSEIAFDDSKPAAVQLDAIKDALNRIGVTKPAQVEVGPLTPFDDIFTDIVYSAPSDSEPIESQADSGTFFNAPQTAPVDADEYDQSAEHAQWPSDSDRPAPPHRHEPPERRQARRASSQNGSHAITGLDAIRLANELRALPPGHGD